MSEVKKATRASKKTAVATVDASPAKPAAGGGLEGAERNTRETFNWNPAYRDWEKIGRASCRERG